MTVNETFNVLALPCDQQSEHMTHHMQQVRYVHYEITT